MSQLEGLFAPRGALASATQHYRTRPGQLALALAVEETLAARGRLVAEAGTGIGKTFAYLVPLMLSGGKALISTATRHLQDQLFARDIPRIKSALGVSISVSLLKGRSNYLCLHRLESARTKGRLDFPEQAIVFRGIQEFSKTTSDGDLANCSAISEESSLWPLITSTRENCLGQGCPQYKDCFVVLARKRAIESDMVVVNHHLLCADMALREEAMGDLLPTVDHMVIDEAHSLADIAPQFFGRSVSTSTLSTFSRDLLAAGLTHARDAASWPDLAGALERAVGDLRIAAKRPAGGAGPDADTENAAFRVGFSRLDDPMRAQWVEKIDVILRALYACREVLEINAVRDAELAQLHVRVSDLMERLDEFVGETDDQDGPSRVFVRWIDVTRHVVSLHITPFDVSTQFQSEMNKHQRSWVFVSATLTVAGQFSYFQERLGLGDAQTMIAQSPFDYGQQGLLVVPQTLPDPKAPDLLIQLLADSAITALMRQTPGGIFILCTSLRAVDNARSLFRSGGRVFDDREVLIQGDQPRHQLLERFRAHGRAILVGSHSFWEGVDVPGEALSMVLIDKLPFSSPDDPVLQAREQYARGQGRDPFMTLSVPEAAILLKQGVGRLIRTETDRGVVLVGDRRLAETAYGRRILQSLPPFARTRDLGEALAWLNAPRTLTATTPTDA